MTALIAVIALTKLNTKAAIMAGLNRGSSTFRRVVQDLAPNVRDASSKLGSSWLIAAMPARMPVGMFRKMKHTTSITPVPVISIGGTLNARI